MRFEVSLGNVGSPPTCRPTPPQPTGLEGMDGRYGIRFDALDLHAGQEAELSLHVLRDGTPAPDLTPYLGVAAHAVFISAADLTYVHAHAAPAAAQTAGGTGSPMMHDMTGMTGMAMPGMGHAGGPADGHGASMCGHPRPAPTHSGSVHGWRAGPHRAFRGRRDVRPAVFLTAALAAVPALLTIFAGATQAQGFIPVRESHGCAAAHGEWQAGHGAFRHRLTA